jgi:hypothetical protein
LHVQVGTPFPERIQANLEERARAIIERRSDLEVRNRAPNPVDGEERNDSGGVLVKATAKAP